MPIQIFLLTVESRNSTTHERSTRPSAVRVPLSRPVVVTAAGFQTQPRTTDPFEYQRLQPSRVAGNVSQFATTLWACAAAGKTHPTALTNSTTPKCRLTAAAPSSPATPPTPSTRLPTPAPAAPRRPGGAGSTTSRRWSGRLGAAP